MGGGGAGESKAAQEFLRPQEDAARRPGCSESRALPAEEEGAPAGGRDWPKTDQTGDGWEGCVPPAGPLTLGRSVPTPLFLLPSPLPPPPRLSWGPFPPATDSLCTLPHSPAPQAGKTLGREERWKVWIPRDKGRPGTQQVIS